MAGDTTELIRRIFERWNRGGDDAREPRADELHPQIEIHSRTAELMSDGGAYRGLEGTRQWLSDLDDAFGEFHLNMDEFHDVGDRLLVLGSIDIRGRTGGTELHEPIAWIFDFADTLILRMQTFRSHEEGRVAAGLE